MSVAREDGTIGQDDATDEIMDRLVKSVTQNPPDRPSSPKTRKRSRLNRKSCEYVMKQEVQADLIIRLFDGLLNWRGQNHLKTWF